MKSSFLSSIEKRVTDGNLKSPNLTLKFLSPGQKFSATVDTLPVISASVEKIEFNPDAYWDNLSTKRLGNTMFYIDVIPTTMPVLDR